MQFFDRVQQGNKPFNTVDTHVGESAAVSEYKEHFKSQWRIRKGRDEEKEGKKLQNEGEDHFKFALDALDSFIM